MFVAFFFFALYLFVTLLQCGVSWFAHVVCLYVSLM